MVAQATWAVYKLLKRDDGADADGEDSDSHTEEITTSLSLLILITLLIVALFVSYMLQTRRIQAVHETVISILAGSFVGLILRLTAAQSLLGNVTFKYQFFFNLLLPPIILASGYELHQGRFFRHIGTILTFAFAGTFISALVLGIILYLWALLPIESSLTFVDAMSVGATLSATDPVTILAIFNTYKVDPKLYTTIFGESILNDAIAIVLFQTAQRYSAYGREVEEGEVSPGLSPLKIVESLGFFLLNFFSSLVIGLTIGIGTSLLLKFTYVRRFPKIESCIVLLIAYASYFSANAIEMSGIVSLLFCGICLKHYAYHNMSRRTQLTIKFIFQILAQLSENFIFIYLGLSLFTETDLVFKPGFIIVTCIGICAARYMAVFPLSSLINVVNRYRHRRAGKPEPEDVMPWSYQAMLFWAGLRGAVGVALAAGLTGPNKSPLKATILVVVILTVIIFGGTTARMLEILNIRTGVVEDVDSDDEFDIEVIKPGHSYSKRAGVAFGHNPKASNAGSSERIPLDRSTTNDQIDGYLKTGSYSSGHARTPPPGRPDSAIGSRKNSSLRIARDGDFGAQAQGLLVPSEQDSEDEDAGADLDLPPAARRPQLHPPAPGGGRARGWDAPNRTTSAPPGVAAEGHGPGPDVHGESGTSHSRHGSVTGRAQGFRQFLSGSAEDPATWFRHLDEGFIKPRLLLDPKDGSGNGNGRHGDGNV